MDIERLLEKIKRIEMLAKDALEELGDFSTEAADVEEFIGKQEKVLNSSKASKKSKLDKILALMED